MYQQVPNLTKALVPKLMRNFQPQLHEDALFPTAAAKNCAFPMAGRACNFYFDDKSPRAITRRNESSTEAEQKAMALARAELVAR